MNENKAPIMRVYTDGQAPTRGTEKSAGLDLYNNGKDMLIEPGDWQRIYLDLRMELPTGTVGLIVPRSSMGMKGITIKNTIGVIDSDYRGQVGLALVNNGNESYVVRHGDRVAQMIVIPYAHTRIIAPGEDEELSVTGRGDGGFGSTGR